MSDEYLETEKKDGHTTTLKASSVIYRTAHFLLINNKRFMIIFLLSFIAIALFLNYIYFDNYVDIPDNGTVHVGNTEPVYHFLLRASGLIEGGEFRNLDTDMSRLWNVQFLYVFAYLYALEWIVLKIFSLLSRLRRRTS